jgi:uncharacterized protein YfaS (alpha-2-macroglobulin family)
VRVRQSPNLRGAHPWNLVRDPWSTEAQQLCVEGLKHGERYKIVLRQGLPSSTGEALLKSADYELYVRDRSPHVHFTGKNYVLPRVGDGQLAELLAVTGLANE